MNDQQQYLQQGLRQAREASRGLAQFDDPDVEVTVKANVRTEKAALAAIREPLATLFDFGKEPSGDGGVGGGQKNYFVQNGRMGHTFYELGIVNGERKRKFLDAGQGAERGAILYYALPGDMDEETPVWLEIMDGQGNVVRTLHQKPADYEEWDDAIQNRIRQPGMHPIMEAHLAKYASLMPSLALIYQLVDDERGETIRASEMLGAPAPGALDRLRAQIAAETARQGGRGRRGRQRPAG